ncbi:hypothetical protein HJG60_010074 [Phyllostomus discolor]|uniref:Uncharacterized protein n=1 Tax=Phyllostomus discolor TaxID=89673 RepID=A0A834EJY5_9CHIR|nr:hypothetical protein HJG60_010074 [Phyllostomus discolor]
MKSPLRRPQGPVRGWHRGRGFTRCIPVAAGDGPSAWRAATTLRASVPGRVFEGIPVLSRGQETLLLWLLLLFTKSGGGLGRLGRGRRNGEKGGRAGRGACPARSGRGSPGRSRSGPAPSDLGGHRFSATAVPQHLGASRNEK